MAKQTLYAYVDGNDHGDDVVALVEQRLDALVAERKWISKDVWVVNQREDGAWDLGINLAVAAKKPKGWVEDAVAVAGVLGELHRKTGKRFVIGLSDDTGETRDVFAIESGAPDLEKLRVALQDAS
jgi:hypothetical protein